MNCTRCLTTVSPEFSNVRELSLRNVGLQETVNTLNCTNCQTCISVRARKDENWENLDSSLRKRRRGNGWEVIEEKDELIKLYVLGQVVYNEMEGHLDDSHVYFHFPDETDLVKILWENETAIGFYTLKLKGSIVFGTMESYEITTLDTAYILKAHRNRGHGISILEDILKSFPEEDIGISTPISPSMYRVIYKFLSLNPSYRLKLWEVSGVGSEGNRKLIYFTLKSLFNSQ